MATIIIKNSAIESVDNPNNDMDISVIKFKNANNAITDELTITPFGKVESYKNTTAGITYTFDDTKLTLIESTTNNVTINVPGVLNTITTLINDATQYVGDSLSNSGPWQNNPFPSIGFAITTIGDGLAPIAASNKIRVINIGSPITTIAANAFSLQTSLTTVTGSSTITTMGASAFADSTSLITIDLSSVTDIPSNAFNTCNHLSSITLSSSLNTIGGSAFQGCSLLTDITLPSSLTLIETSAFANCSSLAKVVIPANTAFSQGGNTFSGCGVIKMIFLAAYSSLSSNIANILAGFQNSPNVKVYYLDGQGWPTSVNVNTNGQYTLLDLVNLKTVTNGSLSGLLSYYTTAGGLQVSNSSQTYYYAFNPGYVPPGGGGGTGGGTGGGGAACFLGKAPVLTPSGYRRIDSLKVGDLVTTAEGEAVPIQAVFIKSYTPSNTINPYIIPKGQFGATMNVAISPDHLVQTAAGKMVKARFLGLEQKALTEPFNYYNIELPTYENMIVAGVTVESKYPTITAELTIAQLSKFLEENSEVLTPEVLSQIKMNVTRASNGKIQLQTLKKF